MGENLHVRGTTMGAMLTEGCRSPTSHRVHVTDTRRCSSRPKHDGTFFARHLRVGFGVVDRHLDQSVERTAKPL